MKDWLKNGEDRPATGTSFSFQLLEITFSGKMKHQEKSKRWNFTSSSILISDEKSESKWDSDEETVEPARNCNQMSKVSVSE